MKKHSRLGHWTPSPLSTNDQGSRWLVLRDRDARIRLGVVVLATLVLTALAYGWGLPLPYRIGEVWAHDVEARVDFIVDGKPYSAGDVIIKRGQKITEEQRNLMREETRAFEHSPLFEFHHKLQRVLALFLLMSLMAT